ncbi:MAG: hypothetical protein Q8911_07980 [Bacillota bacterium]|nr:hypothetical protein [Bacillota bacterium]
MLFTKTLFSKMLPSDKINDNLEQSDAVTNSIEEETPALSSSNLMSRFYRFQKNSDAEAPDVLYENEAWAPKNETTGLFRKLRMNVE